MSFRFLILALFLACLGGQAFAQGQTAQPVVTGYMTTSGCPSVALTPCFVQFGAGGGGGGGSVTQGTTPWVDNITQWANVALGAPSNYGTSPGAVNVPGVNAFVTNSANAGENHMGQVGGLEARVTSTPTVQNASYVSGNCIGGFNSIAIARVNGGNLILNSVMVKSIGGSVPTITVYVFDSNPSSSTCTDKSTFTLNAADADKLVAAPFALSLAAPTGTSTTFGENINMARMAVAGGSSGSGVTTLYYALVSGSTFTPATTTDIHVTMQADLN